MWPRDPGPTGELALSLFHAWKPGQIFVIYEAYLDASGTHSDSPILSVGGRVARLGQWVEFDRRWKRHLKKHDLEYFHATDYRNRRPPYSSWHVNKHSAFLDRLTRIAGRHTLFGFTATMNRAEYQEVYANLDRPRKVRPDSRYGLCFRLALLEVLSTLRRSFPGEEQTVHFILELGDPDSGDAKRIFELAAKEAPPEISSRLGTISYGPKKRFPGLQAADLIAFASWHALQREEAPLRNLPPGFTLQEASSSPQAAASAPVFNYPITSDIMRTVTDRAISDWEARKRWWQEGGGGA